MPPRREVHSIQESQNLGLAKFVHNRLLLRVTH